MKAHMDFPGGGNARERHAFGPARRVLEAWSTGEVLPVLEQVQAHARAGAWVLGFVAYEAAPAFDAAMPVLVPVAGLPLAAFGVFDAPLPRAATLDRAERAAARPETPAAPAHWSWLHDTPSIHAGVEQIRAAIARGEVYQVNLTTRLRAAFAGSAPALFAALCSAQPDGYCLHLDGGRWQLLSVSPELFFDWTPQGVLSTQPMKGTAARDADPARDTALREAMLSSEKELAENRMIVDLLRNDLGRIAELGSVQVPRLFEAVALPTAWQMVSTVRCQTRAQVGLPEVFAALFPCGSVTGAPKIAAMAAIRDLERAPRGAYCGALGMVRPGGHATFAVGIRTVVLDTESGAAECGIGSGITLDSTPAAEEQEWRVKQRFLERAALPPDTGT